MQVVKSPFDLQELKEAHALPILLQTYLEAFMEGLTKNFGPSFWQRDATGDQGEAIVVLEHGDNKDYPVILGLCEEGGTLSDCAPEFVARKILRGKEPTDQLEIYQIFVLCNNESGLNLFSTVGSMDDDTEAFLAELALDLPVGEVKIW